MTSLKTKLRLVKRRGYKVMCWWCGHQDSIENLTLDHLYPKSKGGDSCFENLRLSCFSCNSSRADSLYPPAIYHLNRVSSQVSFPSHSRKSIFIPIE